MRARGFIITTDAFLAITVLAVLILSSIIYVSQISSTSWHSADLVSISRDELTVLEKERIIEDSLEQSSAELITSKLNYSPNAYCFELSIYPQNDPDTPVMHAIKSGCTKSSSDIRVAERAIVVNDQGNISFFIAKMGAWQK